MIATMIATLDGWSGFAVLWGVVLAVLLAIYFVLGTVLHLVNRRFPERRIQQRAQGAIARDIGQSMAALASIAVYVAGGLYAAAHGWTPLAPLPASWWSVPVMGLVSLLLYDTWFYWLHRAMHTPALYRFHALHHRSITPTTWSNNADSLVGAFVEQSYFLVVPFLVPIPLEVLIAHKLYDQVTGMISHCGFEYFASPSTRAPWPFLCTIFHDQHHSNFRCNYGNTFSFWDRVMGTLHPRYDGLVEKMTAPGASTPGSDRTPAGR